MPYLFKISVNIGRSESGSYPVVTLDHQGKPITIKTLKEPRWGDIQILDYKAPNDALIMRYEYPFGPISNVQKEVQKAYEKKNYDASFFVPLLDFDSMRINDDIKAKKAWQITYYYQYIENDLNKVIDMKLRKRDPHFMAKDLYCILKTACCGMALLQSRGLVHGDLEPACIQINSHGSPL